ncbi:SWI/SNF complex component SNF12 homolog [Ipomoea triloba]|uniref:SWI/SNF complex component SNF12 homolog n=1 Tax=Ipomoea triloba TaxID=35885 RepID=UPI00125DC60B|nr:SWI/SNF complex component SNF12 homolog [Ipomoea triloba]
MSANNNNQQQPAQNTGFSSLFPNSPFVRPNVAIPLTPPPGFQISAMHAYFLAQLEQSQSQSQPLGGNAEKKQQKLPAEEHSERVRNFAPESVFYAHLLEMEAQVDEATARKKAAVQEAVIMKKPPSFLQNTLRVYIFNTFANQGCKNEAAEPPSWTLRIVGRVLEESQEGSMAPKFSSFLKRVTVSLDRNLYPDNHLITWDRARSGALPDAFEVKRKGNQEFTVGITLELNNLPEKYRVSPALKAVIGLEVESRSRIVHLICKYICDRKLRVPDDPSCFICDPPLLRVFGKAVAKLTEVPQKITPHLSPPQPIHLQHRIGLSGENPAGIACYDVLVDEPVPIQKELDDFLGSIDKSKELGVMEESISEDMEKLQEHKRRRALLLGFSQSPVEFVNGQLDSHGKGVKFDGGESSSRNEHQSDVYNQPWVEDAVIRYLNRKPTSDAPRKM